MCIKHNQHEDKKMKVYDCFMYLNEDVVLDLRLNYLNKFVDKFVIVESLFLHNGKKKNYYLI